MIAFWLDIDWIELNIFGSDVVGLGYVGLVEFPGEIGTPLSIRKILFVSLLYNVTDGQNHKKGGGWQHRSEL